MVPDDPAGPALHRFIAAQDPVFAQVCSELQHGRKTTHWMWFVFPQVKGLGQSAMAQRYAIEGLAEAEAYLAHPVLGDRLVACTHAMLGWAGRRSAASILGQVDALKFCSSMTLFETAALRQTAHADCFGHALDAFCQGRRDEGTVHYLTPVPTRPDPENGLRELCRREAR